MNRTVMAFIVAPLWAPVAAGAVVYTFPYAGEFLWAAAAAGVLQSALVTYLGVLVLGVPTFLFLRSRKMTAFWIAPASGGIIGAAWGIMFTTCLVFSLGGMDAVQKLINSNGNLTQMSLSPALLGAIIATTFWLIARPDQAKRADA